MSDQQTQSNLRGISFMLAAMTFFIVGDALTKAAGARGAGLPVGELLFLRSLSALAVLFPFVWRMGALARLPQLYSQPMLIRNIGEVCGSLLYVTSLVHIPIANATSIMQTSPLVITAAAALFLGDKVGWRRWTATLVGFIGALLIIRPTSPDFSLWYLPAIISIAFVTMRDLGTRYIEKAVPTQLITFLQFLLAGLGGLAYGLVETWKMPTAITALQLGASGLFLTVGSLFLVMALRSGGEIATIIPFRYSIVMWSILIGYVVWGELPHMTSVIGIVIVVSAGLYTVHREQVRRREQQAGKIAGN
jgi:drug/metabolite transporter (DMT)-like permease